MDLGGGLIYLVTSTLGKEIYIHNMFKCRVSTVTPYMVNRPRPEKNCFFARHIFCRVCADL